MQQGYWEEGERIKTQTTKQTWAGEPSEARVPHTNLLEQLAQHLLAVYGLPVERMSGHLHNCLTDLPADPGPTPRLRAAGSLKPTGPPLGSVRKAGAWTRRPSPRLIWKKELQCWGP